MIIMKYTEKRIVKGEGNRLLQLAETAFVILTLIMVLLLIKNCLEIKELSQLKSEYVGIFSDIDSALALEMTGEEQDELLGDCDVRLRSVVYHENKAADRVVGLKSHLNEAYELWIMLYRDAVLSRNDLQQKDNVKVFYKNLDKSRQEILLEMDGAVLRLENSNIQLLVLLLVLVLIMAGFALYQMRRVHEDNSTEIAVLNNGRKEFHTDTEWLISTLKILKQICTHICLIDAENKKEYVVYDNGEIIISPKSCFDEWGKKASCSNCVAEAAYESKGVKSKFEYKNGQAYYVNAAYIEIDNRGYVLEMVSLADKHALKFRPDK